MRTIDANYVLDALGIFSDCEHGDTHFLNGIETAREIVEQAPTVGGWISVKDRLPETNDEVLTTYIVNGDKTKRFVESASYCDDTDGEGFWTSPWDEYIVPGTRQEVIAWMPMPKPYKPPKEVDENE